MPKMNVKRLQTLVDYLKELPKDNYCQVSWGICDSAKCGFSHACDIPAFKKLGYENNCYNGEAFEDAAACFFGLPHGMAAWLSSCGYPATTWYSPKTFIKRVEAIIDGRIEAIADYHFKIKPKKKVLTPA